MIRTRKKAADEAAKAARKVGREEKRAQKEEERIRKELKKQRKAQARQEAERNGGGGGERSGVLILARRALRLAAHHPSLSFLDLSSPLRALHHHHVLSALALTSPTRQRYQPSHLDLPRLDPPFPCCSRSCRTSSRRMTSACTTATICPSGCSDCRRVGINAHVCAHFLPRSGVEFYAYARSERPRFPAATTYGTPFQTFLIVDPFINNSVLFRTISQCPRHGQPHGVNTRDTPILRPRKPSSTALQPFPVPFQLIPLLPHDRSLPLPAASRSLHVRSRNTGCLCIPLLPITPQHFQTPLPAFNTSSPYISVLLYTSSRPNYPIQPTPSPSAAPRFTVPIRPSSSPNSFTDRTSFF